MTEYPDDSPKPYTTAQLADIANALGLGRNIKHEAVRRVVGIARSLVSQQQQAANPQPGFLKWQAEAAAKAAKLEIALSKIYKRYPLLGSAAAARARAAFQIYEANKGNGRRGRKPPNHVITALIQLYAVWHDVNSRRDAGKEDFIRAALGPFGHSPEDRAFDNHRKQALATFKRKN
jgi:hypothetical protein